MRKGTTETKWTQGTRATQKCTSLSSLKSLPSLPGDHAGFIPPHGGYEKLLSYQKALIVYDATVYFCNRFIHRKSRTYDQMVQAARSGKQNIAEGSDASGTSKEAEIKLTGVAKASQKELLEDYRDFMRNHSISEWPATHAYAQRLSKLSRTPEANYQTSRHRTSRPSDLR